MEPDTARYLANRIRTQHGIDGQASLAQIGEVVRARGGLFVTAQNLGGSCFGFHPERRLWAVLVDVDATAREAGHECGHLVLQDNFDHGIDYPELEGEELETVCDRMGETLAGEEWRDERCR